MPCDPIVTLDVQIGQCDESGSIPVACDVSFQPPSPPCEQNSTWIASLDWGDGSELDFIRFGESLGWSCSATHRYSFVGGQYAIRLSSLSTAQPFEQTMVVRMAACSPNCTCPVPGGIQIGGSCFDIGSIVPLVFEVNDPSRCMSQVVWHVAELSGACEAECGGELKSQQWVSSTPATNLLLDPAAYKPGRYVATAVVDSSRSRCCEQACQFGTFAQAVPFSIRPKECPSVEGVTIALAKAGPEGVEYDFDIEVAGDTQLSNLAIDFGDGSQATKCLCGGRSLRLSHSYASGEARTVSLSALHGDACCAEDLVSIQLPTETAKVSPASGFLAWTWLSCLFLGSIQMALPLQASYQKPITAVLALGGSIVWVAWFLRRPMACSVAWNFYVLFWWCWYIGTCLGYFITNPAAWISFSLVATGFYVLCSRLGCSGRKAFWPTPAYR